MTDVASYFLSLLFWVVCDLNINQTHIKKKKKKSDFFHPKCDTELLN